jgi:hypothetical protein
MILPTDFWPMRTKYVPADEIENRKKANTALKVFYVSLITGFIITFIMKNSKSFNESPKLNYNTYNTAKQLTDSEKAQILDSFKKDLKRTKSQSN